MARRDVLPQRRSSLKRAGSDRRPLVVGAVIAALLGVMILVWAATRDQAPAASAPSAQQPVPPEASAGAATPAASTSAKSPGRSESAPAVPAIAPDAEFKNTCSYEAADAGAGPRLIARSKIVNTGNIGIEVDVQASWSQGDAERITETKRVAVAWRKSAVANFSVAATPAQIDLIRRHQGSDPNCKVDVAIVATTGDAR